MRDVVGFRRSRTITFARSTGRRWKPPDPAKAASIPAYRRCRPRGWAVERELIAGETNGYTTTDGFHRIAVDARLAPAQAAKTMIHEAAHALMHAADSVGPQLRRESHRGRMEVEAESVAYVLAGLLGLDTAAHSVGYVAGWSGGDLAVVADTARAVLATVHTLADALDDSTADCGATDSAGDAA